MNAKDILTLTKMEKEYKDISGAKWGTDPSIKDPILRRLVSVAQTYRLGRLIPDNETEVWLEILAMSMGSNSYISSKSGILYDGSKPDYAQATEAANAIFKLMNINHQVEEKDFPDISIWERREKAFMKTINIKEEESTNLLTGENEAKDKDTNTSTEEK